MSEKDPFESLRPKSEPVPVGASFVFYVETPKLSTQQDLFEFVRDVDLSSFASIAKRLGENSDAPLAQLIGDHGQEIWKEVVGLLQLLVSEKLSDLACLLVDNERSWRENSPSRAKKWEAELVGGAYRRSFELRAAVAAEITTEQAVNIVARAVEIGRLKEVGKLILPLLLSQGKSEGKSEPMTMN